MKETLTALDVDKDILLEIIQIQSEVVEAGVDLSNIMFLVARRAQEITQADGAVVELVEDEDMVYRATAGIADPYLGLRLKVESSLSGLCIQEGMPLNCLDSETDDRVDGVACRTVGLRSMIVAPLIHNDKVVGVLKVLSSQVAKFSEQDINILELLSRLISASMYTAVHYKDDVLYIKATQDSMTGINNRSRFYESLRTCIARIEQTQEPLVIMILDMDDLKLINDNLGHIVGDAAIKEVVKRIKVVIRERDIFCRLGGDEFGIVIDSLKSVKDVLELKKRIKQAFNKPFVYEDSVLDLSVSIGFAVYGEDGTDVNQLIERADQKMYDEKALNKDK